MASNLHSVSLRSLGQFGMYAESEGRYDDLRVASSLTNCIFDKNGKIASRKGWKSVLASAISGTPNVAAIHYYRKEIGETDYWVVAAEKKLYKVEGAVGAGTATDITGAITAPSATGWQFVNYNNKVIGLQQGDNPIGWDGTGNFADWGSGTLPDGNCLLSAWGRLFATDADGQVIRWTATLGEDFDAVGGGSLNVRLVWPNGKDHIIALAAFDNRLIIFGKRSILVYRDSAATTTNEGLNPNSSGFTLEESVEGVGAYSRDAVAVAGDDILFLAEDGVRSFARSVQYEKLPLQTLSRNLDPDIAAHIATIDAADCKAVYHSSESLWLLRLGTVYYYFDIKEPIFDDKEGRTSPILRGALWLGMSWLAAYSGDDENLRFGFGSGLVGEYDGYADNTSTYTMDMTTVWMSFPELQLGERLKILKRLVMFANTEKEYISTFRWAWDFSQNFTSRSITVTQNSTPAEWNEAEWGEDEWSGDSDSVFIGRTHGAGYGTYLKLGWSVEVDDSKFAFNSILLQLKTGRISR